MKHCLAKIGLLIAAALLATWSSGCASFPQWSSSATPRFAGPSSRVAPVVNPSDANRRPDGGATATVRGQDSGPGGYTRGPMPVSGQPATSAGGPAASTAQLPADIEGYQGAGPAGGSRQYTLPPPPGQPPAFGGPGLGSPLLGPPQVGGELGLPQNFADIDAVVQEARSGRFMFGVGVNSSAGVTGQIVIDERNFDYKRIPTSFDDFINGTAWRGAGQGFRIEALPGTQVQRYLISFTEPYFFFGQYSLNLSGFYYNRNFFDWSEQRLGARAALGYRVTPDLSLTVAGRAEQIDITNPRVRGVEALEEVLGESQIYSGQVTLTHDTRDQPFAPTEGHLIELSFTQAFGSFDYPRADIDYRQYFLIRERPDGSGRHTFSYGVQTGLSGGNTPLYDNYFAGGFSSLRGFDFRGASPLDKGVRVGGEFQFLGSLEYMYPLTADDMIKGVVFVDFGTVEQKIELHAENFRVAPGIGIRLNIPALGPAPLALDLAFPVAHAPFDDIQNFSFFFGLGR